MMFSNSSAPKMALALLITAGGLASCDGRRASSLEEATFHVETISAEVKNEVFDSENKASATLMKGNSNIVHKLFQYSACLQDSVSFAPIVRTRFAVGDGETEREITTNNDGCLLWEEKHPVSDISSDSDRLMRFKRTFTAREGFSGTQVLELALNPLDGTLLDIRKLKQLPETLETSTRLLTFESDMQATLTTSRGALSLAQSFIPKVELTFLGHPKNETQITPLMTLKPAQLFRLQFAPQVLRRTNKNEVKAVGLKGGKFNFWFVVSKKDPTRNDIAAEDIVAEYQGQADVLFDGTVVEDVLLRVHDMAGVLSRNHVLMVLEPQGSLALQARSGFFTGIIPPLRGNDAAVSVYPVEGQAAARIARKIDTALAELRETRSSVQVLAKYSGLKPEMNASARLLEAASQGISGHAEKEFLKGYCDRLYTKELILHVPHEGRFSKIKDLFASDDEKKIEVLKECEKDPESFVRLDTRDFVEEVNGQPVWIEGSPVPKTISVDRTFRYSHTQSTSSTVGVNGSFGAAAEAGMGLPGGVGVKIGGGGEWNVVRSRNKSSSTGVSTDIIEVHKFDVNSEKYQIDATTRRCALVTPIVAGGKKGFFVCASSTRRRKIVESYHLVYHEIPSSPMTDESSADNSRWRLIIRGDEMYKMFETMMTKENTVLEFTKLVLTVDGKTNLLPDFRVTQEFPGAVLPAKQ